MKISIKKFIDSIDFDKIQRDDYKIDRENPNNFSYWYPKVKDCGIPMAETKYYIFTEKEAILFYHNDISEENYLEYKKKLTSLINKKLDELGIDRTKEYSIKNGCYSDKFCNCNTLGQNICERFLNIQNASLGLETGGFSEIVIRELIPAKNSPTIYNGLPFRTEFRVFVDFDNNKLLYVVNYWDYDYCYSSLCKEDKLTFDKYYKNIEKDYIKNVNKVKELVIKKLFPYNNQNKDSLSGKWSIDFLLEDNKIYLIDMAVAERSAYWDPKKAE